MKKKVFLLITILIIPIFIIGLFELTLWIADFGKSYPLFIQNLTTYSTNQKYPEKYFNSGDILVPELIEQQFPVVKKKNTFRIVTLGGSTTAGFPFEVNINWPFFIKHYLSETQTAKTIECINLGISAINSHTVLDMLDQVYQADPDLILIYMGHNEFYGAMGVASSQNTGGSRTIIKLVLWLKEFRTYQLLENIIAAVRSSKDDTPSGKSLMNQMIGKANISRENALYHKTINNFAANLEEIIVSIKNENIPVIISNLVSNLRDQYPLGQSPKLLEDESLKQKYQSALKIEPQQPLAAKSIYKRLLKQHPYIAEVNFRLGKVYDKVGKTDSARTFYQQAIDLDPMPFRAPSEMNAVIKDLAETYSIPIADTQNLFKIYSSANLPGNDLFLEHLHPNPIGYALMALAMLDKISGQNILDFTLPTTPDSLLQLMPFTELDSRIGEIKIIYLLDDFPFNGRTVFEPDPPESPQVDIIAQKHVYEGLYWDAAHFELGDYFSGTGDKQQALKEYTAVIINDPTNPSAFYKIGDIYGFLQNWQKAISYYNQALKITPDEAYLFAKLGKALMINEQTDAGLLVLEQVIKLEKNRKTLKKEDMSTLYYLMGVGYTRKKIWPKAEAAVQLALDYDRKSYPAYQLKQQIKRLKK